MLFALLLAASAPAARPAALPPAAQAPAPPKGFVPPAVPSLKPDKEGYCQKTEFIGWSKDGSEAAWGESYCKEPPPDYAWDTLWRVSRAGKVKSWLIGSQAGATMKPETRGKLLFGDVYRKAGKKAPAGPFSADAKIEGDYLIVAFQSKDPGLKAPPPATRAVKLPYAAWQNVKPPKVGELFWSPDGGAVAITIEAVKKEPNGGKLPVSQVELFELTPGPQAKALPPPGRMPTMRPPPAPAPKKR